jgi:hypothetical protein
MIHLLISLIMLPFTLLGVGIRLLFGVLGISTHVLLWPLKIFARHTVLCLVVAGVLILYLALKKDPHSLDTLKPAPKVEQTVKTPKGVAPIIERVEKEEDGDSAFATDTYAMMSEPERAAYSKNTFHPRQALNRRYFACTFLHEQRPDEILHAQVMFRDHGAQPWRAAQTARANRQYKWVGCHRRLSSGLRCICHATY